ncbi:hypothetical protein PLICRDRAFT_30995 [Plicaturopsis crispa FD-325 SS-3]|nr:hypothetical protein PLICRDRAFT_30995 [Plicaturopsis crispa FD-325 SS-3]
MGALLAVAFLLPSLALSASNTPRDAKNPVCVNISSVISTASAVYYPGSENYLQDISHYSTSSTQQSNCSVEPGNADDVAKILQIVGQTRTPFAIKGAGHTSNPGFSSTPGVHISMSRFTEVTYDSQSETVVVGAGNVWDNVYANLDQFGVNVVGGRVPGVGVAGFTLGGGYSWKTNQYGLTIDTVQAYELVKPSGNVSTITADSDPDLFFALKGGFNNFGIVTKFTLKTFPQTKVWGGLVTFGEAVLDKVSAATVAFGTNVTDPKAAIITACNFAVGEPGVAQLLFYDGPEPPSGIYDDFLAIPYVSKNVQTRSFLDLIQASPANITGGYRGIFSTASFERFSPAVIDAVWNETKVWGNFFAAKSGSLVSYDVEPFLPSIFSHNTAATAYPPSRSKGYLPLNIYYSYGDAAQDKLFQDTARASAAHLKAVGLADGQDIANAPSYGNYAIFDTPLSDIYGDNVDRIKAIKNTVDPTNVMSLAGGFRF